MIIPIPYYLFVVFLFICLSCSGKKDLTHEESCIKKFEKLHNKFEKEKYSVIREPLSELLSTCPGSGFLAQALYELADSHFYLKEWMEAKVFSHIPFYETLSGVTKQVAGVGKAKYQVVEFDLYGNNTKVLGLLTDTLTDGRHVIFIPFAPVINIGQVHIVDHEKVKILDMTLKEATDIMTRIGFEADKVYK